MKLRELSSGDRATVVGYEAADPVYRAKLLAMGLTKGCTLKLVKVAPLGDPVKIEVRGYDLSLRKAEADALVVELVPGQATAPPGQATPRPATASRKAAP